MSTRFQDALSGHIQSATLSKARKMMELHDCGTISAERGERTGSSENPPTGKRAADKAYKEATYYMRKDFEEKGYSVTQTFGGWPNKEGQMVGEASFFVADINDTGNLRQDLTDFGREYAQDSVIFIPKGTFRGTNVGTAAREAYKIHGWVAPVDRPPENQGPDLGEEWDFGTASFGEDRVNTTRLRGRPFAFGDEYNQKIPPTTYEQRAGDRQKIKTARQEKEKLDAATKRAAKA
jgi:hypothetical protein